MKGEKNDNKRMNNSSLKSCKKTEKNKTSKRFNITRNMIVFNFCFAAFIGIITGTIAAYTSLSSAKRVVSTTGENQLFSSNMLTECNSEDDLDERSIALSSDVEENSIKVTVCNFAQGDKTKWASNDIGYEMKVILLDSKGNAVTNTEVLGTYKMNGTSFTELATVNGSLSGNEATEDVYSFTVPSQFMKDYKIKIFVKSNITNYKWLGKIISTSEYTATSAWKLTFLNVEMKENAYDLGCINTKLSGQEHANFTLKWNSKYVDIDPWFLEDISKEHPTAAADGWCTLTFEVGGTYMEGENEVAMPNQYNVIFYRTAAVHSGDDPEETWDDIKSYISYSSEGITE